MADTLIISTWGSPSRWGCAKYIHSESKRSVLSCCALLLLTSMYKDSDVILIVLDSLVDADESVIKDSERGRSTCSMCYAKCWNDQSFKSYKELEEYVKRIVKCVVECIYEKDLEERMSADRINIIVGPSVGSPGGKWVFKGEVGDFMGRILLEAGLILDDKLSSGEQISKVVLDTTHGINFMPSVALHLARMISSLIVMRQLADVSLEVYNSDPYPPRVQFRGECSEAEKVGVPELSLNLVHKEIISGIYMPNKISGNILKRNREPDRQLLGYLENLDKYLSQARYVVSSTYYPLPLPLVYSCYNFQYNEAGERLRKALEIWRENIRISSNSVDRSSLELQVDSIYAILLASFACKTAKNLIGDMTMDLVNIESLKELEKLYDKVSELHGILVNHELSQRQLECKTLKEKAKENHTLKCMKIMELKSEDVQGAKGGKCEPDKRIMIAHAGFQWALTEMCINGDKCSVRYIKECDIERIIKNTGLLIEKPL